MLRPRSVWLRLLRLYQVDGAADGALASPLGELEESLPESPVHARSRFRSLTDGDRFALYSVHDAQSVLAPGGSWGRPAGLDDGEHTLIAVREFRRVPLDASSLALTVFTARWGRAVALVAALADFVERAVDLYQPAYLLLAHSLEEPRTALLLMAVQDSVALGAAASSAFSLDDLLREVGPMLARPPESYAYCPEVASCPVVSPYAV